MITSATANTTGSSMIDVHPSTVTSKTILNVGLQMQGKDQLNNRMQEWQRRMDEHKQAERSVIANKLINERNLRMMEMAVKQVLVQGQPQYNIISNNNVIIDAISHFPLPQEHVSNEDYLSSCDEWLLWHRTMPPKTYKGIEPVSEQEVTCTYDSSLLRLDYLPFTSEDELSNCNSDTDKRNLIQTPCDNDEEDNINVIL